MATAAQRIAALEARVTALEARVTREVEARSIAVNSLDARLDVIEAWIATHEDAPLPAEIRTVSVPFLDPAR